MERKPKKRIILRPVGATSGFKTQLEALYARSLKDLKKRTLPAIYDAARSERDAFKSVMDASGAGRKTGFERALERLRDILEDVLIGVGLEFVKAFTGEQERFDKRFGANFTAALSSGIDLERVIRFSSLDDLINAATVKNVALIRGIAGDVEKRIVNTITALMTSGASNAKIALELNEAFDLGVKRSRAIARDQASKWNGDLNRIRQQQAGVTEYVWSTSLDERVRGNPQGKYASARPSHYAREGQTFKWANPPSDGHPSEPINCRCVAKAVIEF